MSENEIKPVVWDLSCQVMEKGWEERTAFDITPCPDGRFIHVDDYQSAIDRLTAERDAALASRDRYWDERDEAQRKLSVAVAEGKGLVADAERYRWLRDNRQEAADYYATAGQLYFGTYGYGGLDAAIDAARAEGGV